MSTRTCELQWCDPATPLVADHPGQEELQGDAVAPVELQLAQHVVQQRHLGNSTVFRGLPHDLHQPDWNPVLEGPRPNTQ